MHLDAARLPSRLESRALRLARRAAVALSLLCLAHPTHAQPQTASDPNHVTIPFLASATRPSELAFEAADCDIASGGDTMSCRFQQVIFTTSDLAPDTCLVTTNGYERTFTKRSATEWTSTERADGDCGTVEEMTLRDAGGVRWTLEIRKSPSGSAKVCAATPTSDLERLEWRNLRRPLPCRYVQPGGISR